jgi:hypothetical protein
MREIVKFGVGNAIGTLLYTRFLSDALQFDWGRVIFVGLFTAFGIAIHSRVWQKESQGR